MDSVARRPLCACGMNKNWVAGALLTGGIGVGLAAGVAGWPAQLQPWPVLMPVPPHA